MRKLHCTETRKAFWWNKQIANIIGTKRMLGINPIIITADACICNYSSRDVLYQGQNQITCKYIGDNKFEINIQSRRSW